MLLCDLSLIPFCLCVFLGSVFLSTNDDTFAQDESGVSREEITQCFVDVVDKQKKKINNRIALRELRKELVNWPGLLEEEGSLQKAEEEAERKDLVVDGKLCGLRLSSRSWFLLRGVFI